MRSGRSILLREFRQWNFYRGLIQGIPDSESNRADVERIVARERESQNEEPYLIPPIERVVEREESHGLTRGFLPTIACVARFVSCDAARDPTNRMASALTIIWFQDQWAFPIAPGAREQIRAIDWEQHAHDSDILIGGCIS